MKKVKNATTEPTVFPRADPEALRAFDPSTKQCTMNCGQHKDDPRSAAELKLLCDECVEVHQPARGYIEALEARQPIDLKGYVTDPHQKWKYPPTHMPPSGKLLLLNEGGTTTVGEWSWYGGFVGFRELFKRDLAEEQKAVAYIKEVARAKKRVDGGRKPGAFDGGGSVEDKNSICAENHEVRDTGAGAQDGDVHGNAVLPP